MTSITVDHNIIRQAQLDSLLGLDNSVKHEGDVLALLAYRMGQRQAEAVRDEEAKIARRSRKTWPAQAGYRKALAK